jgi:hypothetical protein
MPRNLRGWLAEASSTRVDAAGIAARPTAAVGAAEPQPYVAAQGILDRCRQHRRAAAGGGVALPTPGRSAGDRHLNQALHLIVLTRLRYDPATRAYAQRRRTEGKTNREIRRCLVRYVARQLYRLLEAQPTL